MARQVDPEEAAKILGLIEQHSEGLTVDQIEAAVGGPRRTLQRRLAELVAAGSVRVLGNRKLRRYHPPAPSRTRVDAFHHLRRATHVPVRRDVLLARYLQGAAYDRHVAVGGSRGSSWRAAGLGLVSLVIYFTASIAPEVLTQVVARRPNIMKIGKGTMYYADGVPYSEAQMVGEEVIAHVRAVPYPFPVATVWSVEVMRDGERRVVAFALPPEIAFSDDKIRTYFQGFAEPQSRKVYADAPVDVWLVDQTFQRQVRLSWASRAR